MTGSAEYCALLQTLESHCEDIGVTGSLLNEIIAVSSQVKHVVYTDIAYIYQYSIL